MADYLAADDAFQRWASLECVTRDQRDIGVTTSVTARVTVSIVVAGLLQIWGLVRQQGHAVERDMLVDHLTIEKISRLSGVPGFGQAMASVGWVEALEPSTLRFPRSLDHMTSPEERKRQLATDRKRRQRERDRGVTVTRDRGRDGHADVTHREEERRGEKSRTKEGARASSVPGSSGKSRFTLDECRRYAESEKGIRFPKGYARTIFYSGDDDPQIEKWLANGSKGAGSEQWRAHFDGLLRGYQESLTKTDERLDLIQSAIDLIPRCASREDFQVTLDELRESGLEL